LTENKEMTANENIINRLMREKIKVKN